MILLNRNSIWSIYYGDTDTVEKIKRRLTIKEYDKDEDGNEAINVSHFYKQIKYNILQFPTGLFYKISHFDTGEILEIDEHDEIYDKDSVIECFHNMEKLDTSFETRDYQVHAAWKCLNFKRGVVAIATAGGKTEVISAVCSLLNKKILLIVHRNNLLINLYERLNKRGVNKSKVIFDSSNIKQALESDIVLMNSATLYSQLKIAKPEFIELMNSFGAFIYDECHHISAISELRPAIQFEPEYILGFTAEPYKEENKRCSDDWCVDSVFGGLLLRITTQYLKDHGYTAQMYHYFIDYEQDDWIPFVPKSWSSVYDFHIVRNKDRRDKAVNVLSLLDSKNIKTLAMVIRVEQGEKVLLDLKERGIDAVMIIGDDTIYRAVPQTHPAAKSRYKISESKGTYLDIIDYMNKGVNIVIASIVLNEGVDISSFRVGMLLAGGKDAIAMTQRIGRINRKKHDGVNEGLFIDFNDKQKPYLNDWTKTRKKQLDSIGSIKLDSARSFIEKIKEFEE